MYSFLFPSPNGISGGVRVRGYTSSLGRGLQCLYAHSPGVKTVYVISSSAKENPSDLILMDSTKEEIDLSI